MKVELKCHHCGELARRVKGDVIYPHRMDLHQLNFFYCDNGHDAAYVGTHRGNKKPLGTLANKEERVARSMAHSHFDPIWRNRVTGKRSEQSRQPAAHGLPKLPSG